MDFTKYKLVADKCQEKSEYFSNLDFSILSANFKEAGETINELVTILTKVAECDTPAEEGANE